MTTIFRQGGSLRMTIPRKAVKELRLTDGDGTIIYIVGEFAMFIPLEYALDRQKLETKLRESLTGQKSA